MSPRFAATGGGAWELDGRPWRWFVVDAFAILLLAALVAVAFWPVYGSWLVFLAVVGFAAVGIGINWLGSRFGWSVGSTVLASVGGWFLFGSALTMPSQGIGVVVPSLRTLRGLATGPVTAWRDMLTLDPPIGETWNLLTVPGFVGFLVGLIGSAFAFRSRKPVAAWVPAAVGYAVAALVGSQVALWPIPVGIAFFVIVLLWTTYRRSKLRDRLSDSGGRFRPLHLATGAAMLGVAGLVAGLVVPAIGSGDRDTLRAAVEIPIDLAEHRSPLQGFRANISKHRASTLFEVRGASPGDIVRVATLDGYDGIAYRVATTSDSAVDETTFRRVGQWIADDTPGAPRSLAVTVHDYADRWVPTVGQTTSVRFGGDRSIPLAEAFFYNRDSGTGVTLAGLRKGDSYTLDAVVPNRPDDTAISRATAGNVAQPRLVDVPEQVRSLARRWTDGIPDAGAQALEIERRLKDGYFSHGQEKEVASQPGHSQARLITLLAEPERMVGDHEQYAVAMALMARELGIPARVIYGYKVGDSPAITGGDVGAWPELYLHEHGWVQFDPTPPTDRTADKIEPPEPPKPQPYVVNPPPPPQKPEVPPEDDQLPIDRGDAPEEEPEFDWAQVGAVVLITGIPLLTIVVPIALILGLKLRRRARRRNDPNVANRVAGAWLELVDKARDLGRSPSVSATRSEQAEQLSSDFGKLEGTADPVALAKEADWLVFAPGDPAEHVARDYWRESATVRKGMRKSVSLPSWVLSGLSTKSFRKIK